MTQAAEIPFRQRTHVDIFGPGPRTRIRIFLDQQYPDQCDLIIYAPYNGETHLLQAPIYSDENGLYAIANVKTYPGIMRLWNA